MKFNKKKGGQGHDCIYYLQYSNILKYFNKILIFVVMIGEDSMMIEEILWQEEISGEIILIPEIEGMGTEIGIETGHIVMAVDLIELQGLN